MVFYKIEASQILDKGCKRDVSRDEQMQIVSEIFEKSEEHFEKTKGDSFIFVAHIRRGKATLGAVLKDRKDTNKLLNKYIRTLPIQLEYPKLSEITFNEFFNLLSSARNNGYIENDEKILNLFDVGDMHPRYNHCDYGESVLNENPSQERVYKICDNLLFNETLAPELDRIYASKHTGAQGHPVHYILQTDNRETRKTISRTLLSALYSNNRIQNKRYCYIDFDERNMPGYELEALYKGSIGGAMIVRYDNEQHGSSNFASNNNDDVKTICEIAMKYRNKVLTILCMPRAAEQMKQNFLNNFGDVAFVEIYEDVIYGEKAIQYLKNRAKEYKIRPDKNLTEFLNTDDSGYSAKNLDDIFNKWYDQKLRNVVYPQYKTVVGNKIAIKNAKPKGSAYDKLQQLIGLESAKKVMDGALNYFKAQKLFADRGVASERPAMHMIFTGNPGTAKTTVARLFAKVMKENGLLPVGDIHEVGRADLVGKYVGWTAKCVKEAFKKAKGGVLFIDEAYSLVDDRDGSFGDEAINTIVQEMENNRADTIVIFAGYPNEMQSFLDKNPGLSSRIAFHIPFEDYSAAELCDISALIAKEKGLRLENDAVSRLNNLFESARQKSDFGNGRFARNIIEKAKMAQANRIMKMDFEKITDDDLFTICAEDIEIPEISNKSTVKIVFCA